MSLKWDNLSPEIKEQIRQDMLLFYKNVNQEIKKLPQPCEACGQCCNFGKAGHRLYASALEFMYLLDKYLVTDNCNEDICPFLKNNKCSVRDRRMLGCRSYFCLHSAQDKIKAENIYEKNLSILKKLHLKYNIDWHYQDCMPY